MSLSEWNVHLFRLINDLGKELPFLNDAFVLLTKASLVLIVLAAAVFFLVPGTRNRLMVICALLAVILAELIRIPVSQLHTNLQPFAELANVNQLVDKPVGNSFPSDHTIIVTAICAVFSFFQKRFAIFWIAFALLVAVSRIWVGAHYPADVLAGILIASASAWIVWWIAAKRIMASRAAAESNS